MISKIWMDEAFIRKSGIFILSYNVSAYYLTRFRALKISNIDSFIYRNVAPL